MEIPLRKPIEKDGKTYDKLVINLENLTGNDMIQAEKELQRRGNTHPNPLLTSEGIAIIAAKSSGHVPEDIMGLSAPDFLMVTNSVNNFLFGWALLTGMQLEV